MSLMTKLAFIAVVAIAAVLFLASPSKHDDPILTAKIQQLSEMMLREGDAFKVEFESERGQRAQFICRRIFEVEPPTSNFKDIERARGSDTAFTWLRCVVEVMDLLEVK